MQRQHPDNGYTEDLINQRTRDAVMAMDYPDDETGPPLAECQVEVVKLDKEIAKAEIELEKIRSEAEAAGVNLTGLAIRPAKGRA